MPISFSNGVSGVFDDLSVTNNIGIGTDSPTETLDVSGNIRSYDSSSNLILGYNAIYDGYGLHNLSSNSLVLTSENNNMSLLSPSGILLDGDSQNTLIQPNIGYVGIGTANPSTKLDVTGDVNIDGDLTFDRYTESVVDNGNSGTSKILYLTNGTIHTCTLTGNCTFTMPTVAAGKSFSLFLNTGSGGFTATFTGVRWSDSTPPTITSTASKIDLLSFISDGTYWYGSFSQNYG